MKPKELTSKTANAIAEMIQLRKLHGQVLLTTADGKSPHASLVAEDYKEAGRQVAQLQMALLGWLYKSERDEEIRDYFEGYLSLTKPELTERKRRVEALKMFQEMHRAMEGR